VQESPTPRPQPADDGVTLRQLQALAEFDEAVALQDEIWGAGFSDRVPASILRIGQKVGGVSAGAFDERGRMLGFVFGLTGVRDGQLVHWSDMLAVREEARGRQLGERLKRYQREIVRALGVRTMLWTFDPLVARNAHFNLNRLRARIAEYVPNFYGTNTGSILHGALPTDRFVAEWDVSAGVDEQDGDSTAAHELPADAPRVVMPTAGNVRVLDPLSSSARVLVSVPIDIETILGADPDLALAWRLATRHALMHYLGRGYQVAAFHRGNDATLPAYELRRSLSLHA
jgi:predicted GNAT superfamily acetyltransferase